MDCEAVCEIITSDAYPPLPTPCHPDQSPVITDMDVCKRLKLLSTETKKLEKMREHLTQSIQLGFELGHTDTSQYLVMAKTELIGVEAKLSAAKSEVSSIGYCPLVTCNTHRRANSKIPVKRGLASTSKDETEFVKPSKRLTASKKFNLSSTSTDNLKITKNSFETLMVDEVEEECTPASPPRPAPIMVKSRGTLKNFLEPIKTYFGEKITAKLAGEFIKNFPIDEDIHRELTNYLTQNNIEYYIITPRNRRPIKVVIKGLPIDTPIEDIASALSAKGYVPTKIVQLTGVRRKNPLPMFQAIFERSNQNMEVYELNQLLGLIVRVDPFRRKLGVVQCFKCNFFHHNQSNCHLKERCLKCGSEHRTNQCSIEGKLENPSCINCQKQGHVAAWRGCEKYPKDKFIFQNANQNRNNGNNFNFHRNQNANSNCNNFVRAGTSYANALKRPEPSSTTVPNQGSRSQTPPTPSLAGIGDVLFLINEIASVFGNQSQISNLVQKLKQTSNPADKLFVITNGLASNNALYCP